MFRLFLPRMPHHRRVFAGFFIYSFVLAGFYSRVAEVQLSLGISKAELGLALLGSPVGTQLVLIFGGGLVARMGQRNTVLAMVPVLALFEVAAALAPSALWLFMALAGAGLAIGALEIVLNLESDRAEHALGRRVMNRSHAFWSFGFFASGLAGGLASQLGLAPALHLVLAGVLGSLLLIPLYAGMTPAPPRARNEGAHARTRFVLPTAAIMALVAVTLPAMLLEGASIDWSVIYMRDSFAAPAFVNVMAFATAAGFQAVTRYVADPVVDRVGPVRTANTLILILGAGCLLVTVAPHVIAALIGFALIGIGSSCIFPLAISAAARRQDRAAALNVAALAQVSFIVFLLAPPLLGFVAQHFGIRLAFGVGLPLVVLALFHVRSLGAEADPDAGTA